MKVIDVELYQQLVKKPKSKYKNVKIEENGIVYSSKKEYEYSKQLENLKKHNIIEDYCSQVTFHLTINEQLICRYIADYVVFYHDGSFAVIDVKGYKSGQAYSIFKLKKKLMKALLNIEIIEV